MLTTVDVGNGTVNISFAFYFNKTNIYIMVTNVHTSVTNVCIMHANLAILATL